MTWEGFSVLAAVEERADMCQNCDSIEMVGCNNGCDLGLHVLDPTTTTTWLSIDLLR